MTPDTAKRGINKMEDYNDVAAFIGFFAACALFMMFCNQINRLIKSRRLLKSTDQIKVGGVITKKIPEQDMPSIPIWANVIMENRVTGKRLPASMDNSGVWFLGGEETEPVKLSLREWFIVDKR